MQEVFVRESLTTFLNNTQRPQDTFVTYIVQRQFWDCFDFELLFPTEGQVRDGDEFICPELFRVIYIEPNPNAQATCNLHLSNTILESERSFIRRIIREFIDWCRNNDLIFMIVGSGNVFRYAGGRILVNDGPLFYRIYFPIFRGMRGAWYFDVFQSHYFIADMLRDNEFLNRSHIRCDGSIIKGIGRMIEFHPNQITDRWERCLETLNDWREQGFPILYPILDHNHPFGLSYDEYIASVKNAFDNTNTVIYNYGPLQCFDLFDKVFYYPTAGGNPTLYTDERVRFDGLFVDNKEIFFHGGAIVLSRRNIHNIEYFNRIDMTSLVLLPDGSYDNFHTLFINCRNHQEAFGLRQSIRTCKYQIQIYIESLDLRINVSNVRDVISDGPNGLVGAFTQNYNNYMRFRDQFANFMANQVTPNYPLVNADVFRHVNRFIFGDPFRPPASN